MIRKLSIILILNPAEMLNCLNLMRNLTFLMRVTNRKVMTKYHSKKESIKKFKTKNNQVPATMEWIHQKITKGLGPTELKKYQRRENINKIYKLNTKITTKTYPNFN